MTTRQTKMVPFKSVVTSMLIGLQLTGFAFADSGVQNKADDAQEQILIGSLVALSGQKISSSDFKVQSQSIINAYANNSANDEGRSDRFEQAMVEMNLMEPAHAESIKASVDAYVGSRLQTEPNMSAAERQQLALDATSQQLDHQFSGAQFSSCDVIGLSLFIGGVGILVGSIFANVYATTLTQTTTTNAQTGGITGSGSSTSSSSPSGSSSSTTVSQSGTSTSTSNSVTTGNPTEKKLMITGAAIGYGLSGLMIIFSLTAGDGGSC